MKQLRAIIGVRDSTEEQAEHGTSVRGAANGRQRAEAMDAMVVYEFTEEGVSGARYESRQEIQKALAMLEADEADVLIMQDVSRLSRDAEYQSAIKKRIERSGKMLVLTDMPMDLNTEEGDLSYGLMGQFAQYERKTIRRRTMRGRRKRAEEGRQPTRSTPPLGYHIVTKADVTRGDHPADALGTYLLCEDRAATARAIFDLCAAGQSLHGICRWLHGQGLPTPGGGRLWRPKTVWGILTNPVYKGEPRFSVHETRYDESRLQRGYRQPFTTNIRPEEQWVRLSAPPIVDAALWERCQDRLRSAQKCRSNRSDRPYLFGGLVRCPRCERRMSGNTNRKRKSPYQYYQCRSSRPSQALDGVVCNRKAYGSKWLGAQVLEGVREVASRPELMRTALLAYRQRNARAGGQAEADRSQRELREVEARIAATVRLQIAATVKGLDPNLYDQALTGMAARKSILEKQIQALAATGLDAETAGDAARQWARMLANVERVMGAIAELEGKAPENEEERTWLDRLVGEGRRLLETVVEDITPTEADGVRIRLQSLSRRPEGFPTMLIV